MRPPMATNVYFDMDGTLAEWQTRPIEEVAKKGYFSNLPVMTNVVAMVKALSQMPEINLYILSAVFQDEHSIKDKQEWLSKYLPEIPTERQIFVPYGQSKSDFLSNKADTDVLLDDFSMNLRDWHGKGVKIYNGINGTKGTWHGYSIHADMVPQIMLHQFLGIINEGRAA